MQTKLSHINKCRKGSSISHLVSLSTHILSILLLLLLFLSSLIAAERSSQQISGPRNNQQSRFHHYTNDELNSDASQESGSDQTNSELPNSYEAEHEHEPDSTESSSIYEPPREISAIRFNDTSVILRWDLLPSAIEHLSFFKVQYKSTKKDSQWKTDPREIHLTTKACQLYGLRPGGYFFIVIAVYNNDDHVESEQLKFKLRARSKIRPTDLPNQKAPNITWHEAASDYFRFKWKYDYKHEDLDYGYLVYWRSSHTVGDFSIFHTYTEDVEIAELEPDTPYESRVLAYNSHGVSEFSEFIRIKTKSLTNTTTTPIPTTSKPSNSVTEFVPVVVNQTTVAPTLKPLINPSSSNNKTTNSDTIQGSSNSTSSSIYISIRDLLLGTEADSASSLYVKYSLILCTLILMIVMSICWISLYQRRRRRHKEAPQSSTHISMQFDLEINGYFKNSFPEKDDSSIPNHHANHGFINNHPHINDFA